jgi:hypothetical protein
MKFIKIISSHWVLRFVLGGLSALVSACDTPNNLPAPGDSYFIKYYGEDGDQIAVDMVVNSDGTIILLGKSSSGLKRIFVTKVNPAGMILWQKNFGGPTDDPKDIEPTIDGNYVILSDYMGAGNTKDAKLLRITPAGAKIDSAVNGTTGNDIVNSITPLTDGGYVIAGFTDYNPNPAVYKDRISSFLHFRCDASLTFFKDADGLWNDVDGYNGEGVTVAGSVNACTKIIEQPNNSFYVFGYSNTNYFNTNNKTILFYYKLNEAGLSNPNYFYNTPEDVESSFVIEVPPTLLKGYFVVSTANKNTGASKLHVSKLKDPLQFDEVEDKQFDQNILGTQNLSGVYATPSLIAPQGYLVVSNETDETGQTNVLLSKVNQSGDEVWSANFGSSRNDTAAAVAELPDGKILILCTVQLDIQLKMALLKVNSKGQFLK